VAVQPVGLEPVERRADQARGLGPERGSAAELVERPDAERDLAGLVDGQLGRHALHVHEPVVVDDELVRRDDVLGLGRDDAESMCRTVAIRSVTWSGACVCSHQALMSSSDGVCFPCSIFDTFEPCQPASSAS
jgi:hypothetical protein